MKSISLFKLTALATLVLVPRLMGQTRLHIAPAPVGHGAHRVELNLLPQLRASSSNIRMAGFPIGPTQLPYPMPSTVANEALANQQYPGGTRCGDLEIAVVLLKRPNRH